MIYARRLAVSCSTSKLNALSLLVIAAPLCGLACSNGNAGAGDMEADTPIKVKDPDQRERWTSQEVTRTGAKHLSAASAPDGTIGVAFFEEAPSVGEECVELGVDPAPIKQLWGLHYASRRGGGSWREEEIAREPFVGAPAGLDLAFSSQGEAHVATMSGAPLTGLVKYCGVHDAALLIRGADGWEAQTAVRTSAEAKSGDPASDYGEVIGLWPALSFTADGGLVLAYKDIHGGGLQSDDRRRADLELAYREAGGAWRALPVDMGRGAGDHIEIALDRSDRITIAYHIPTAAQQGAQQGIWLRRGALGENLSEATAAESVQLFNLSSPDGNALLWDASSNKLHVLYHHATRGYPVLLSQQDDAEFTSLSEGWQEVELGDGRFDQGYDASLAVDSQGRLMAAYYRCTKSTGTIGDCTPQDDALVFAWKDGERWVEEIVDAGSEGALCGREPELLAGDDTVSIVYRCETIESGELIATIKIAERRMLP